MFYEVDLGEFGTKDIEINARDLEFADGDDVLPLLKFCNPVDLIQIIKESFDMLCLEEQEEVLRELNKDFLPLEYYQECVKNLRENNF